jgi:protein gp37
MTATTKIEWADATLNPWTGCTRVSPGCDHCYAATMAKRNPRAFGSWEPGAPRKRTSAAYWHQPLVWNRKAEREGRHIRVFCASMADVFDNQAPEAWRGPMTGAVEGQGGADGD